MTISGFTFVRNAVKYDYPVEESIRSVLPLVNEFIVSIGNSDDETVSLIESIGSPKIKIFHSVWDDSLREGGKVLAVETDKAFQHISPGADWAFYLQADEVVHEKYLDTIKKEAEKNQQNETVEGLLFKYLHFYGSYDYIGDSRRWYNREIRIIRNNKNIQSYRDAQGFRMDGRKLNVKLIDAYVYHYGWVKNIEKMRQKQKELKKQFWTEETDMEKALKKIEQFEFSNFDSLKRFDDSHPSVMKKRIEAKNWNIDLDVNRRNMLFKDALLYHIEKWTGKRLFEYRNYKLI